MGKIEHLFCGDRWEDWDNPVQDSRLPDLLEQRAVENPGELFRSTTDDGRSQLSPVFVEEECGSLTRVASDFSGVDDDEEEDPAPANPKQKFGDRKVPLHLVPPALAIGAARAFREGADRYGPYNWRESGVEAMTYVGAIQRHLAAYLDGEDVDPESSTGKLHLDGIAACVAILLDCTEGGFLIDNRPAPGPGPRLVRTPTKEGE